jgi:hypothetical protein
VKPAVAFVVVCAIAALYACGGSGQSVTATTPIDHRSSPVACAAGSGCASDADCSSGTACVCETGGGAGSAGHSACVTADCRVDADCGPGGSCSQSGGECPRAINGVFCHTKDDQCGNASDCTAPFSDCLYSPEVGHWICVVIGACGG